MNYAVSIKTSSRKNAGTDANVFVTLIGQNGSTPEIRIDHPNYDDFERGSRDSFNLTTSDVGVLQKVRLRHDNAGRKPGWFVDYIEVIRQADGARWLATANTWLARDEGDGSIDRTFNAVPGTSNTWTFKNADADLDPNTAVPTNASFVIDNGQLGIRVEVFDGAVSALLRHGATSQYFAAGSYTLYQGGDYTAAVGGFSALPGQNPRVRVWYMSRV